MLSGNKNKEEPSLAQVIKDFEKIHRKNIKKKRQISKLMKDANTEFDEDILRFYKDYKKAKIPDELQKEFDELAKKRGMTGHAILPIESEKWAVYVAKDLDKPHQKWHLYNTAADIYCSSKEGAKECHNDLKGSIRVLTDFMKCKDKQCREKYYQK